MDNLAISKGGNGGSVMIIAETFTGTGEITTDGGDGKIGGNAGTIHIQTKDNKFKGKIYARGGKEKKGGVKIYGKKWTER